MLRYKDVGYNLYLGRNLYLIYLYLIKIMYMKILIRLNLHYDNKKH